MTPLWSWRNQQAWAWTLAAATTAAVVAGGIAIIAVQAARQRSKEDRVALNCLHALRKVRAGEVELEHDQEEAVELGNGCLLRARMRCCARHMQRR